MIWHKQYLTISGENIKRFFYNLGTKVTLEYHTHIPNIYCFLWVSVWHYNSRFMVNYSEHGADKINIKTQMINLNNTTYQNIKIPPLPAAPQFEVCMYNTVQKSHGLLVVLNLRLAFMLLLAAPTWPLATKLLTQASRCLDETSKFIKSTVTFWPNRNVYCNILSLWPYEPCIFM